MFTYRSCCISLVASRTVVLFICSLLNYAISNAEYIALKPDDLPPNSVDVNIRGDIPPLPTRFRGVSLIRQGDNFYLPILFKNIMMIYSLGAYSSEKKVQGLLRV
jgi:hypothetical protein